jgi:hypothetical protein
MSFLIKRLGALGTIPTTLTMTSSPQSSLAPSSPPPLNELTAGGAVLAILVIPEFAPWISGSGVLHHH